MTEEKFIFLAAHNDDVRSINNMISCIKCLNKTFTCMKEGDDLPVLYCAACNDRIGTFGWTDQL